MAHLASPGSPPSSPSSPSSPEAIKSPAKRRRTCHDLVSEITRASVKARCLNAEAKSLGEQAQYGWQLLEHLMEENESLSEQYLNLLREMEAALSYTLKAINECQNGFLYRSERQGKIEAQVKEAGLVLGSVVDELGVVLEARAVSSVPSTSGAGPSGPGAANDGQGLQSSKDLPTPAHLQNVERSKES